MRSMEIVNAFWDDVWNAHEADAVDRFVADDVVIEAGGQEIAGKDNIKDWVKHFLDHVNARDYSGHEGIRESLGLYQLLFSDGDLRIRVQDQVAEGDRVVSRWVAEGHNRGRALRLWGITISQIADGEIVEDWSASDNLDVLRQLGVRRLLLLGVDWLRSRRGFE